MFRIFRNLHKLNRLHLLLISTFLLWSNPSFCTPESILSELGFTPLKGRAIDFELTALDGKIIRLSEFKGKWVWLTFWATWCGPCTIEMPALDRLYQANKKRGLVVLGISVDTGSANSVKEFVGNHEIHFPILLDSNGTVSAKYRASAIPTIYAITPDGFLAGILRGAKDWSPSNVAPKLAALLTHKKMAVQQEKDSDKKPDTSIALPSDLVPPVLDIEYPKEKLFRGDIFPVTVIVSWKGDPEQYLLKVPRITLPQSLVQGEISSYTSSEDGKSILRYQYPITTKNEGKHKIGPVELAYSARTGSDEQYTRHPGLEIEVEKPKTIYWVIGSTCLAIVTVCITVAIMLFRRRKSESVQKSTLTDWSAPYDVIRKMKITGKNKEYCAELLKLNLKIQQELGEVNQKLDQLVEQVNFGGISLTDQELLQYERNVESLIARIQKT